VNRLKKQLKNGLMLTVLFMIFSLTTGCFGGLDDAQEVSATHLNAFFAKSDNPTAEERFQKIVSTVSSNAEDSPVDDKDDAVEIIQKSMVFGITKPYYIADNPNKPQSDTRRTIIARFPKGSFADSDEIFGESNTDKDLFFSIELNKEGDDWKISDVDDEDEEDVPQTNIDWKEVDPTDYLG
jgi:hypothetical protein